MEAGGGSIMGVVWIREDGGTGDDEESCEDEGCVSGSLTGQKLVSSSSGRSEFACVSRVCKTIAVGGSSASAKSGSVTREALCKGVEDNKCSLLAWITASLPIAIGVGKEESEWPLGSFLSSLAGCTSMKTGTSPVKSTADDAVESMVETAVAAASCSGVSPPTPTLV